MASSPLVDFHCHLDLYPDFAQAVKRCEEGKIFTLAVTTTPRAWSRNQAITSSTQYVRAALGLHPQLVAQYANELSLFESLLPDTRYVGEIGLDAGPQHYRSLELQKAVFQRILQLCAKAGGKVLSVHSVRAVKAVLDTIDQNLPSTHGRVVLHWFTGSRAEARRAVDLGCYFSINAAMLTESKRRFWVSCLPIERLLTETDGPFTHVDGRPSQSGDVNETLASLADIFGTSHAEMRAQVARNLHVLLGNGS